MHENKYRNETALHVNTRSPATRQRSWIIAGLALATSAAYIQWKARKAEREHPPEGSFAIIDGARLHYTDRGEGPVVVLLHGNGATTDDFDLSGVVGLATTSYRVINIDRPGYGHSSRPYGTIWTPEAQAELVVKALKQLQIEQPIVVGHSWGTMVAMAMGLQHPDYVRSLVLMSGYYYPTARLDVPIVAAPAIPVLGTLLRHTLSPLLTRLIWPKLTARLFQPAAVSPGFKRFPKWMTLRPSQLRASAADAALQVPAAYALSKRYRGLRVPTVILAGDCDRIVDTEKQSVRLHHELENSLLKQLPGEGHMIHHTMPYDVMNAIDIAASAPVQQDAPALPHARQLAL